MFILTNNYLKNQRKNQYRQYFTVLTKMEGQIKIILIQHLWAVISFPTNNLVLLSLVHLKRLLSIQKRKISKEPFIIKEWISHRLLETLGKEFVKLQKVWWKKQKSDKPKEQIRVRTQQW